MIICRIREPVSLVHPSIFFRTGWSPESAQTPKIDTPPGTASGASGKTPELKLLPTQHQALLGKGPKGYKTKALCRALTQVPNDQHPDISWKNMHSQPQYIIPDLLVTWPWKRVYNSMIDEIKDEANAWVTSLALFEPSQLKKFHACDFSNWYSPWSHSSLEYWFIFLS